MGQTIAMGLLPPSNSMTISLSLLRAVCRRLTTKGPGVKATSSSISNLPAWKLLDEIASHPFSCAQTRNGPKGPLQSRCRGSESVGIARGQLCVAAPVAAAISPAGVAAPGTGIFDSEVCAAHGLTGVGCGGGPKAAPDPRVAFVRSGLIPIGRALACH